MAVRRSASALNVRILTCLFWEEDSKHVCNVTAETNETNLGSLVFVQLPTGADEKTEEQNLLFKVAGKEDKLHRLNSLKKKKL